MTTQHQADLYLLPHTSQYPSLIHSKEDLESVLLVPSTFTSKSEWDLVVPFFLAKGKYHLLIPDFSFYGENVSPDAAVVRSQQLFSIRETSALLAHLIRKTAIKGKAKIVGLSLGAIIAISVASLYSDVVNDAVFVSGYEVYPHLDPAGIAPYGLWVINRIERLVPIRIIRWAMDGADIQQELRSGTNGSLSFCREIIRCLSGVDSWPPIPWPSRTMIVAAGKKNWFLPSADHPEDAKKLADIGKIMNDRTVAVVHPLMRHPWNRQAPGLFAEAVWTWFENGKVKEGFQHL